jgi:anti-sigma regulatory factor (Ser/Thr protein kinase)
VSVAPVAANTFFHEALFYEGERELVRECTAFVRDGLARDEPVLVVLGHRKLEMLRDNLGRDALRVQLADMADVGANPALIIPAWREFVDAHPGHRLRGIGEPIWAARGGEELVECQRHEALLNIAFDGTPTWWLMCPYDTATLDPAVLDEAERSHPWVRHGANAEPSRTYLDPLAVDAAPLPEPPATAAVLPFARDALAEVRRLAARHAARAGLRAGQVADLTLAVNEVATNSVCHGGGSGTLRAWTDDAAVICEVRDAGHISDPLADRIDPRDSVDAPRGLWLANQLCDLVQVRSSAHDGTVVRLHMRRRD